MSIARQLALALAVATLLAGCGSGASTENGLTARTPAQIVAAARVAATTAATVHVAGSIVDSGKPISVHMDLFSGKGGQGRIVLEEHSIELAYADKAVYINSDAGFYRRFAGAAAAQRLQGRWLKGSAHGEALGALTALTSLPRLLGSALSAHGALTRGADATIEGHKAVAVTDLARGGTLYVASTGTPYPLEILQRGGGKLVFSKWNQPVSIEPPAHAINIKQLEAR